MKVLLHRINGLLSILLAVAGIAMLVSGDWTLTDESGILFILALFQIVMAAVAGVVGLLFPKEGTKLSERAKKVLQKTDGLIDMHMWNHEEVRAGDVSCMNLYTEIIPFLDSVWLGEGFYYKKYSPEYMLAEVSGIPYGVTGQMLEGGGDLYLGMLYGMNNRYGWGYTNAVQMYKIWDDFGITDSKMLGYWHSKNPVKTDNPKVLSTVYLKEGEALVCLYNFSDRAESFDVSVDKGLLGFSPRSASEIRFGKRERKIGNTNKRLKLGKRKGIIMNLKG